MTYRCISWESGFFLLNALLSFTHCQACDWMQLESYIGYTPSTTRIRVWRPRDLKQWIRNVKLLLCTSEEINVGSLRLHVSSDHVLNCEALVRWSGISRVMLKDIFSGPRLLLLLCRPRPRLPPNVEPWFRAFGADLGEDVDGALLVLLWISFLSAGLYYSSNTTNVAFLRV